MLGYCIQCKCKREITRGSLEVVNETGRIVYDGMCGTCSASIRRVVSKDQASKL